MAVLGLHAYNAYTHTQLSHKYSSCHYATGMQWRRHIILTGQMIQHPPFKEVRVMSQHYNHVMKLAILNTWYFPLVIKTEKQQ